MGSAASIESSITEEEFDKLVMEKFNELDVDKTNYLENAEISAVVDWTIEYFGERLGNNKDDIKTNLMKRIDSNADGKLDIDEFRVLFKEILNRQALIEKAKVKFIEFDTNKGGTIDKDEIKAVIDWVMSAYPADNVENFTKKLISAIDINNDGHLSLLEFTNLFEQMLIRLELLRHAKIKFEELDADKSGFLENAEIDNVINWTLTHYSNKTPEQIKVYREALLKRVDFNNDGMLSELEFCDVFAEFLERACLVEEAKKKFAELDINKSGFLERSELMPIVRKWIHKFCEFDLVLDTGTDTIIDIFMEKIDINKDDKISLLEFMETFEDVITTYKPTQIVKAQEMGLNVAVSKQVSLLV